MPLRRPHTKSRAGCKRCKERHIKCDEAQPVCGACARYNVPCIPKAAKSSAAQVAQARRLGASYSQSASPAPSPSPLPVKFEDLTPTLPIWKVELLHHWVLEVPESFNISDGFVTGWRGPYVKAALHHDFLLHMILMLSALHLALTKSPEFTEQHRAFILEGCSDAVAGFRAAAQNITESNYHVLQGFPYLLSTYALALTQLDREERGEGVLDEMTHILSLTGGNSFVQCKIIPFMMSRNLPPFIPMEAFYTGSDEFQDDLDLVRALGKLQPWIDSSEDSPPVRTINTRALQVFIKAHEQYHLKTHLRPVAFPTAVQSEYPELLKQRNPLAMVILAHYAVILWQCRDQWWCSNWGARVVSAIASVMPEKYVGALTWPLQTLNIPAPKKGGLFHILSHEANAAEMQDRTRSESGGGAYAYSDTR